MSAHSQNYAPGNPVSGFRGGDTTGTSESGWPGTNMSNTIWVEFDLGRTYDITTIRFFGDDAGTWVSETYTVGVKSTAQSAYTAVIDSAPAREARWFETQPQVSARFVRLMVRGTDGADKVQAREFEVYGVPADNVGADGSVRRARPADALNTVALYSLRGRLLSESLSPARHGSGVVLRAGRGGACVKVQVW